MIKKHVMVLNIMREIMRNKLLILVLLLSFTIFCSCEVNSGLLYNYKLNRNNNDFFERLLRYENFEEIEITKLQLYYCQHGETHDHFYEVEYRNISSNKSYHHVFNYFENQYEMFIPYDSDAAAEEEELDEDYCVTWTSMMKKAKEEGNYKLFTEKEIQSYIDKAKKKNK